MFKLTCAARGSCLVGPARQLFLADPHDDVTAGFPYVPAACEVWGALPTAGGSCTTAPGTAAGLAASRLLVEVPRGWCLLSFFPSAAASSLLGSTGRAPPGEVLEKSRCTSGYVWLLPCSWGWQRGCGTSLGHRVMLGGLAGTLGLTAAQVLVLLWCARDTRWRRDEVRVPSCAPRTSWAAARVCFLLLVQAGLATRSPGVHSALCFSC